MGSTVTLQHYGRGLTNYMRAFHKTQTGSKIALRLANKSIRTPSEASIRTPSEAVISECQVYSSGPVFFALKWRSPLVRLPLRYSLPFAAFIALDVGTLLLILITEAPLHNVDYKSWVAKWVCLLYTSDAADDTPC
eukprot:4407837-Amphidinium_carterae.2